MCCLFLAITALQAGIIIDQEGNFSMKIRTQLKKILANSL